MAKADEDIVVVYSTFQEDDSRTAGFGADYFVLDIRQDEWNKNAEEGTVNLYIKADWLDTKTLCALKLSGTMGDLRKMFADKVEVERTAFNLFLKGRRMRNEQTVLGLKLAEDANNIIDARRQ